MFLQRAGAGPGRKAAGFFKKKPQDAPVVLVCEKQVIADKENTGSHLLNVCTFLRGMCCEGEDRSGWNPYVELMVPHSNTYPSFAAISSSLTGFLASSHQRSCLLRNAPFFHVLGPVTQRFRLEFDLSFVFPHVVPLLHLFCVIA